MSRAACQLRAARRDVPGFRDLGIEGGRHGRGGADPVSRRCCAAAPIRGELASLLATSSAMSETIPPSLVLITIGSVTNISIAALVHRRPVAGRGGGAWRWSSSPGSARAAPIPAAGRRAPVQSDGPHLCDRGAGPDPALRDPLCGHRRDRDRDRGLDRRRRLYRAAWASSSTASSTGAGSTRSWSIRFR